MVRNAIVVALAVAFLSGTVASAGPLDTDFGHIYRKIQIESDPTGASILINSRRIGPTPQVIRVDNHLSMIQIILSKPGYLETASEIKLTEPVTAIHANITPIP